MKRREEITCPGCGHLVYLSPMDGWRNDSDGYTCVPPNTTHSMHIVPALIRRGVLDDLSAKVQALRAEVKVVRGEERPSASEGALIAYSRVLELLNGGSGA